MKFFVFIFEIKDNRNFYASTHYIFAKKTKDPSMQNKLHFLTFFLFSIILSAQTLHIYGGSDQDEYLGCLNCDSYDKNSIWNSYGTYGNSYNTKSIWNSYGTYGNEYSSYSPWNNYASNPPIVVDKNGNFYGYLTVNSYKSQRANSSLASLLYEYHELIKKDVSGWYNKIFK